jgi:hypothetical protein
MRRIATIFALTASFVLAAAAPGFGAPVRDDQSVITDPVKWGEWVGD